MSEQDARSVLDLGPGGLALTRLSSATWLERATLALLLSALALALLGVYFGCASVAIDAPTVHTDGAFQTASSLHRLASGQAVGRDFLPYLGLGPLYTLYPTFALAGGDLHASVIAAYLTVHLFAAASFSVLFYLAARPARAWHALLPGTFFLLLTNMVPHYFPNAVLTALQPGNSLRPIRSFGPYVVAMLVCVVAERVASPRRRFLALGATSTLAMLWSNDYGVPSAGLFGTMALALALRPGQPNKRESVALLLAGGLLGVLVGLVVTRGGLFSLLHYNFVDVATDQWWFFWPWVPESRVLSVRDLDKVLVPEVNQGLVVLALALVRAGLRRRVPDVAFALIGTASFFGGFIPSVGGHIEHGQHGYFVGFQLWTYLALAAWCASGVRTFMLREPLLARRAAWVLTLLVALALGAVFSAQRREAHARDVRAAEQDPGRFYVGELGAYLALMWRPYVDLARAARGSTTLEEYWGLWSAVQQAPSLTPVDSIIHALGSVRSRYAAAVHEAPSRIVTTRAAFSAWQTWNLSASWWFYRQLLQEYVPTAVSPTTVVWSKGGRASWSPRACSVENGPRPTLSVEGDRRALYEVTLHYRLRGAGRRALLRVRNNINVVDGGYLSIDPNARTAIFPVVAANGERLDLNIVSAPEHPMTLELEGCSAQHVPFNHPDVISVPGSS